MPARKDFGNHLQKQEPMPVYALLSTENVLLVEAITAVRGRVLTAAADFNRDEFRAGEPGSVERAVAAASTLPMMAARRWVHLADIHKLKAKDHLPLLSYLERPSPSSVLCLSGDKLDQRTKLGQKLLSATSLFVLEPPRPQDLPVWLERRARQRHLTVEHDAAQLLTDLIGGDLGDLDMALEKLATYAGDDATITSEHVEAVVAPTRIDSIFKLTDAIGARDLSRASLQLRNALGGGENALLVLTMIARQLRHLLMVKELREKGQKSGDIATQIGIRPFLVEPLVAQARRYDSDELCHALAAVARADVSLKSSRLAPGVILDRLLVEVISASEAAS
ncbi:MAG: DNA polymerase III subunit delta [Deltaproteobacteria bacterium RIFOXYA12_FULL_58_15]|nr:MAG: DNA polymerase III subunit delta [Deltaproteobacteria bacterium RIFOXYA12_FULL_58_15]OGR08445.1 MAG: DNA polymerase III subunit delta [Deltaproteobacteria bacterium RIFOXYB12_FULL_58_9]